MLRDALDNNIIGKFFDLADAILKSASLAGLRQLEQTLEEHLSKFESISDEELKQSEILQCQKNSLRCLRMMLLRQVARLMSNDSTEWVAALKERYTDLLQLSTSTKLQDVSDPLVIVMNRYLSLFAGVMSLDGAPDTYSGIKENINTLVKMVDHVCEFDYDKVSLQEVHEEILPLTLREAMLTGTDITREDRAKPRSIVESAVLSVTERCVDSLINARIWSLGRQKITGSRSKKYDALVEMKILNQQICDIVARIDAVARLLNLHRYPQYRQLYVEHQKRNRLTARHETSTRYLYEDAIPMLSCVIDHDKFEEQLGIATKLIFKSIQVVGSLYRSALVLETSENTRLFLSGLVNNINTDVRILIPLAAGFDKRNANAESNIPLMLIFLKNALRISTTLLYLLDQDERPGLKAIVSTKEGLMLALGAFGHSDYASLYALVLQTRFGVLDEDKSEISERDEIFKTYANEIAELIDQYLADANESTVETKKLDAQFIVDFYISCLSCCKHKSDFEAMALNGLDKRIMKLTVDLDKRNDKAVIFLIQCITKMLAGSQLADGNELDAETKKKRQVIAEILIKIGYEGMASLTWGKAVDDFLQEHDTYQMSAVTHRLYTVLIRTVANLLLIIKPDAPNKEAREILKILIKSDAYLKHSAENVMMRLLAVNPLSRIPLLKVKPNKASFLIEPDKKSRVNPAVSKPANKSKKKRSASGKRRPDVTSPFDEVMAFHGSLAKVLEFYRGALNRREKMEQRHAIVGCAKCVEHYKWDSGKSDLVSDLKYRASHAFKSSELDPLSSTSAQLKNQFDAIMAEWDRLYPPAPIVVSKPVRRVVVARPPVITCTMSLFSTTVTRTAPVVKVVEPVDEFRDIRVNHPLLIHFTPSQDSVLSLLESADMEPLIHGGTVFDTMFGVVPGDLDLLVFAKDVASLMDLLKKNKARLNIVDIRKNQHENVVVLTFDEAKIQSEIRKNSDKSLEIYVITNMTEKHNALIQLARRFGVTFLAYDRRQQTILDPIKLYANLQHHHVIGVQTLAVNIDAYLDENPVRILDVIKRIAKCHHVGVRIGMSPELQESVGKKRHLLNGRKGKYSIEKFNRLFMCGYAASSSIVLQHYDCLRYIFPVLQPVTLPYFLQACNEHDAKLAEMEALNLSPVDFESLRAEFFANAFYMAFITDAQIRKLNLSDQLIFYKSCTDFISKIAFETKFKNCDEMVSRIQANWWSRFSEPVNNNKMRK